MSLQFFLEGGSIFGVTGSLPKSMNSIRFYFFGIFGGIVFDQAIRYTLRGSWNSFAVYVIRHLFSVLGHATEIGHHTFDSVRRMV